MEERTILPERVQNHLRSITETSGLPRTVESVKLLTENWLAKKDLFERQTTLLGMERVATFAEDERRGAILLTYSGSLLFFGPLDGEKKRWFEYASIKLRSDVPSLVRETGVSLSGEVQIGVPACMGNCSLKQSSDILLIAVCPENLSAADEEKRLREATIFLTNGFVKINRTLTLPSDTVGHFTKKNIVQYVARKNEITQTLAAQVIEDYLDMVEAGVLLGERVPLGAIGRLSLAVRPARSARIGRNPATGEELLIAAKPEKSIPTITFSGRLKDRASAVPTQTQQDESEE